MNKKNRRDIGKTFLTFLFNQPVGKSRWVIALEKVYAVLELVSRVFMVITTIMVMILIWVRIVEKMMWLGRVLTQLLMLSSIIDSIYTNGSAQGILDELADLQLIESPRRHF